MLFYTKIKKTTACLQMHYVAKGKVFPLQARCGPEGG